MRYQPRILSLSKGAAAPGQCASATVANAIAIAILGDRGALVRIVERRPVGGIVNNDGSNGAGPPDNAKLSSPFPCCHRVLQCVHPPSIDGRYDVARRDLSPERARRINLCYPCATPLAMDGEGSPS